MEGVAKGRILVVDADPSVGSHFQRVLECTGFLVESVTTLAAMRARLISVSYDLALLDVNLGPEGGFDGLGMVLKEAPFTRVYMLTGTDSVARAVEALRRGAAGFFEKGGEVRKLTEALEAAVVPQSLTEADLSEIGLIGRSPSLMNVVDKVKRLRDVDSMVLILGESGTGKEVIARAIHRMSKRGKQRFGAVNCGAIPEALLESEMFGHKRGTFTDAKADRKGIFELCSDGTLLLDEIGDMPLSLQMKLLRVLQEREVTPVGASEAVKINTRVIAATHRDILGEARAKRFREDLYFRLSIVVLHVPPLRQRREDIPLLVEHFLELCNKRFGSEVRLPGPVVMGRLMAYDWPGNVRELQNALERGVVLSVDGEVDARDAFAHLALGHSEPAAKAAPADAFEQTFFDLPLTDAKQAFERRYLEYQVQRCNGQVTEVAERSGRYRADVYRLLSRYGIGHGKYRPSANH